VGLWTQKPSLCAGHLHACLCAGCSGELCLTDPACVLGGCMPACALAAALGCASQTQPVRWAAVCQPVRWLQL